MPKHTKKERAKKSSTRASAAKSSNPIKVKGRSNQLLRGSTVDRINKSFTLKKNLMAIRVMKSLSARSALGGPILQMAKDAASGKTMRRIKKKK